MLKLRTILLCNYPYYILLVLVIIISIPRLLIPRTSNYSESSNTITGIIQSINIKNSTLKLTIKNKEKVLVYYYLNEDINYKQLELGDKIKVVGEFIKPSPNTTENIFDYQKYLANKNIFYTVQATSLTIINKNKNIFYKVKQTFKNKAAISPYLNAFILGDKSLLSEKVVASYQENGISHLLAISGMHISLLSAMFLKLLKAIKVKENSRYFLTSLLLINYLLLLDLSPSALRGVLFFILFSINRVYYFYIKPQNIFLLVFIITLLINPFYIYDIGFQYSFTISLTLILTSSMITGSYLLKLLKTSLLAFLVSIPISLYNYYQINILSIIYNLFYVPLVSIIIFPLSIGTIIIKPLLPLYNFMTNILEKSSLFLTKITIGKLIFPKLSIYIYLLYYLLIILLLIRLPKSKKYLIIFILILTLHYNYPSIKKTSFITMLDIGQGDSLLLNIHGKTILIDTGGKERFNESNNTSKTVAPIIIPYLKSIGIRKINFLLLTHGDFDHMGEAINLVNDFNVENVIFNNGKYNKLELELIKTLLKKKVPYYQNIKELNIRNNKLYFLNDKVYNNENDNSIVLYTEINNQKILFMGDAGVEVEQDLIDKYNLKNIDILKIGHHGSKTSSSEEFIDYIDPKYSIISVGKNNRYNHPNDEVLETLNGSNIYRTDKDGSVIFKFKKDKLEINICPPSKGV